MDDIPDLYLVTKYMGSNYVIDVVKNGRDLHYYLVMSGFNSMELSSEEVNILLKMEK